MKTIGITEARRNWGTLLDRIGKGESVMITRRGLPVAVMGPAQDQVRQAIERMLEDRKGRTTGGMSIREMIDEGQRR